MYNPGQSIFLLKANQGLSYQSRFPGALSIPPNIILMQAASEPPAYFELLTLTNHSTAPAL